MFISNLPFFYYMPIPVEIKKFLRREGIVLLVRGAPGTGKTTLALEIMKNYNFAYLGTKKNIEEMERTHPWISKDMKEKMFAIEEKYSYEDTQSFGQMFYLVPESLRHVLNLHERGDIEGIIVDSWHAVINELNLKAMEEKEREELYDSSSLFMKIVRFSDNGVKFIIVKEGEEDDELSYLADGLVTMYRKIEDGRIYRWLQIEKLRGETIGKNRYFYTLQGSRFTHFTSGSFKHPRNIGGVDKENLKYIESVYFGDVFNYKSGNVIVFDYGEYVPKNYKIIPIMGFIAGHIVRGGKALIIPPNDIDMSELKYFIYLFALERFYSNIVYIHGSDAMESFSKKVNMSKPHDIVKAVLDELNDYSGPTPPVVIVGYDRLYSYLTSREIMQVLYRIKDAIKIRGGVMLIAGNITDKEIKIFSSSISEVYVKFHNNGGDVIMYGIKPWTHVYHLDVKYNRFPRIVKRVMV